VHGGTGRSGMALFNGCASKNNCKLVSANLLVALAQNCGRERIGSRFMKRAAESLGLHPRRARIEPRAFNRVHQSFKGAPGNLSIDAWDGSGEVSRVLWRKFNAQSCRFSTKPI
jgi:hypothetical protein